jgi:hypothetical protein
MQTATADTTTTSTTDVLIGSMTVTPASGDYFVLFEASIEQGQADKNCHINIYSGGTLVAASDKLFDAAIANEALPVSTMAKVTVNGAQAIEARWRTSNGTSTLTCHVRQLFTLKLA